MVAASSCLLCELGGVGLHPAIEIGDDNRVRVKAGIISGLPSGTFPDRVHTDSAAGDGRFWTSMGDSRQASQRGPTGRLVGPVA